MEKDCCAPKHLHNCFGATCYVFHLGLINWRKYKHMLTLNNSNAQAQHYSQHLIINCHQSTCCLKGCSSPRRPENWGSKNRLLIRWLHPGVCFVHSRKTWAADACACAASKWPRPHSACGRVLQYPIFTVISDTILDLARSKSFSKLMRWDSIKDDEWATKFKPATRNFSWTSSSADPEANSGALHPFSWQATREPLARIDEWQGHPSDHLPKCSPRQPKSCTKRTMHQNILLDTALCNLETSPGS